MKIDLEQAKQDHPTFWKRAKIALIALGAGLVLGLAGGYKLAHAATGNVPVTSQVTVSCPGAGLPAVVNNVPTCPQDSTGGGGGGGTTPPPAGDFALCPSDTTKWVGFGSSMRPHFGGEGSMNVWTLVIPATSVNNYRAVSNRWVEYNGGGTYDWSLSTKACSFDPADALPGVDYTGTPYKPKQPMIGRGVNSVFSFNYGLIAPTDPTKGNLNPNQVVYFSIRAATCPLGCGENGDLKKP